MNTKKKKKIITWSVVGTLVVLTFIFNLFFSIAFVMGDSMYPTYHDGQFLLTTRHYTIERFDVVTISKGEILIKRVIGMPNETIVYKDNVLYINGEQVDDPYNTVTEDFEVTLGDNEYFCMGDNREDSWDSRKYGAFSADKIITEVM